MKRSEPVERVGPIQFTRGQIGKPPLTQSQMRLAEMAVNDEPAAVERLHKQQQLVRKAWAIEKAKELLIAVNQGPVNLDEEAAVLVAMVRGLREAGTVNLKACEEVGITTAIQLHLEAIWWQAYNAAREGKNQ